MDGRNSLEHGDFLIFDYVGNRIFSFKLLGTNRREQKEDGGLKLGVMDEAEELNVEHQNSVDPKGKNWASDSSSSSSSDAGWKGATACKVSDIHVIFSADIFKSSRTIQPKNPYFLAKVQSKRKNWLYVSVDVVGDYKLEFPSTMSIRDSAGREFETKVVNWKDGRIWLVGVWRSLCNHCRCVVVETRIVVYEEDPNNPGILISEELSEFFY
ncbi:hypothetical protein BC332_18781 [Capsicum chinense]|nr:hypothetical protein BC332_18781 [Capsicum chinense]